MSVLVVHYNAVRDLRGCLRSLPAATGAVSPAALPGAEAKTEMRSPGTAYAAAFETIVVDNSSRDLEGLPSEFPEARWILNRENVGWGRAVNQAAEAARGEILVLLNPDTEPLPGSLQALARFFKERAAEPLGPVGGKLLFSDGSIQPSCGPFPHLASLLWRMILPPTRRKNYLRLSREKPTCVNWVSGAFLAVRRSAFEALGGFTPEFFLYYEDVDFCLRASRLGLRTYYLPSAAAYHHNPHALRKGRDRDLERIIQDSRMLYFRKHRPAWEVWVLKVLHAMRGTP